MVKLFCLLLKCLVRYRTLDSNMKSAVPPALKNGNGIPVFGIDDVTTAIFSIT